MEFHEISNVFPLMSSEEFSELVKDIKENGLIEPIILLGKKILDGRNRFNACKEAGIEPEFETFVGTSPLMFVISKNLKRRHLTKSQKACVAVEILPFFEKEAKERQGTRTDISQKIDRSQFERATEQAGKVFDVNRQYLFNAKKLKEDAPEQFEEVKAGKAKLAQVSLKLKKEKQLERIGSGELKPPEGKFSLIVIDPPWNTGNHDSDNFRGAVKYPSMETEEILKINLPTADDCVLWFWAVDAFLEEALQIIAAWGFERKATLIWDKQKLGLGKWLRNEHEYCFLCVKGKPVFSGENFRSILHSPRQSHSEKPDEFYKLIEQASPYKEKLDYFARKKREGWSAFGDEV